MAAVDTAAPEGSSSTGAIAANSNAAVNATTRVFSALSRNGLAPRRLGHVHPKFKTPYIAVVWMSVFAFVVSILLGWKWGPLVGFSLIATLAVIVVVPVYMLICLGTIWHYWTKRRAKFNPLLHLVLPIGGMERVYVDDETVGTTSAAGIPPVA